MNIFRPEKLSEIIGNKSVVRTLQVSLDAAKQANKALPHILLFGGPGLGKTALSNAIANEMGVSFKTYLSNGFKNKEDVRLALLELNVDGYDPFGASVGIKKPSIMFLDEIHQLSTKVQEAFFQAMEENVYTADSIGQNGNKTQQRYWVPQFTLIGATSKAGDLDNAFVSRFQLTFSLNPYESDEIEKIIEDYAKRLLYAIADDAIKEIAKRSRGIARKALNFLARCEDTAKVFNKEIIDKEAVLKTFEFLQIDQGGLESLDRIVLAYLYKIYPQKIGTARLASTLNISENALKEIVEPYLMRIGFILIDIRGRQISESGRLYCEENGLVEKATASLKLRRIS